MEGQSPSSRSSSDKAANGTAFSATNVLDASNGMPRRQHQVEVKQGINTQKREALSTPASALLCRENKNGLFQGFAEEAPSHEFGA